MKNKKLFAILTLVCFMFTLMPVAAFATSTDASVVKPILVAPELEIDTLDNTAKVTAPTGYDIFKVTESGGVYTIGNKAITNTDINLSKTETRMFVAVLAGAGASAIDAEYVLTVDAADIDKAAADAAYDRSSVMTKENNVSVDPLETAVVTFKVVDKYNNHDKADGVYVWTTQGTSKAPATALLVAEGSDKDADGKEMPEGVYYVAGPIATEKEINVSFTAAGNYTIHASFDIPEFDNGKIADAKELKSADPTKTIEVVSGSLSSKHYQANVTLPAGTYNLYADVNDEIATVVDETIDGVVSGNIIGTVYVEANNVAEEEVTVQMVAPTGAELAGITLDIAAVGAVEVSAEEVRTNDLGYATFKVSGNQEGTYKVYVTCGQFEFTIEVQVGATQAVEIECTGEPVNPVDILGDKDLAGEIEFTMYDVNGNKLTVGDSVVQGWDKAENSFDTTYNGKDVTGYVAVIAQPAASKITDKDLFFNGKTIESRRAFTVEGEYEFKVVLNNGNYATAKIEIKEFTTPVELVLEYPATVELGSDVALGDLYWLDANKVQKDAFGKVNLAAKGYAVENFSTTTGLLTVKGDEKYAGQTITVTAVDERYNLIDTVEIVVAEEASELAFAEKTAEVNVNNKIRVNVVDANGNVVALGDGDDNDGIVDISYVILDKPEGARVFASTTDSSKVESNGYFTMSLTSNKVGNVAVQAVLKYTEVNTDNENTNVVKYYTGTQIFAVGTAGVGDVVVMSVGSNEIVINDAKATIDAAPIVENSRTFVPFRALAEAFGATVAYDEATQAVTAELNGVTVVMTIGSAEYTVNGETKTADVAPFINGSRTMVPVRFAAEAFGIKVIPTYDEKGATADILFNL